MKQTAQLYVGVFVIALVLSIYADNTNAALLSVNFLITAIALRVLAYKAETLGGNENLSVFVKPIGITVLVLTVYHPMSLLPALFDLASLEHPLAPEILESTILWFLCGVCLFWVGFLLNLGKVLANALAAQSVFDLRPSHEALLAFAKGSLFIGLALYMLTVVVAGYSNPLSALLDMSEFRRKAFSLGATTAIATFTFLTFAIPKTMLLAQLADKNQRFSSADKRFWITFIAVEIGVSFTFGIRGVFLLTLLLIFVAWYRRYRCLPLSWIILGGASAVAIITTLGILREYLSLSETEKTAVGAFISNATESAEASLLLAISTVLKRLDALQRFGEIVEGFSYRFSDENLLWGKGIAGELLLYAPRALVPFEKPYTTGYYFMEMFYPNSVGVFSFEVSFLGEAFLNFGAWGIPMFALLAGVIIRTLNELFSEERLNANWSLTFWYFWTLLLPSNMLNQGVFVVAMPLLLSVIHGAVSLSLVQRLRAAASPKPSTP